MYNLAAYLTMCGAIQEHRSKGHRVKLRGRLMTGFELVLDKSAVQTPRQMYASLARAGYCVVYRCAPCNHSSPLCVLALVVSCAVLVGALLWCDYKQAFQQIAHL